MPRFNVELVFVNRDPTRMTNATSLAAMPDGTLLIAGFRPALSKTNEQTAGTNGPKLKEEGVLLSVSGSGDIEVLAKHGRFGFNRHEIVRVCDSNSAYVVTISDRLEPNPIRMTRETGGKVAVSRVGLPSLNELWRRTYKVAPFFGFDLRAIASNEMLRLAISGNLAGSELLPNDLTNPRTVLLTIDASGAEIGRASLEVEGNVAIRSLSISKNGKLALTGSIYNIPQGVPVMVADNEVASRGAVIIQCDGSGTVLTNFNYATLPMKRQPGSMHAETVAWLDDRHLILGGAFLGIADFAGNRIQFPQRGIHQGFFATVDSASGLMKKFTVSYASNRMIASAVVHKKGNIFALVIERFKPDYRVVDSIDGGRVVLPLPRHPQKNFSRMLVAEYSPSLELIAETEFARSRFPFFRLGQTMIQSDEGFLILVNLPYDTTVTGKQFVQRDGNPVQAVLRVR